jgi:putative aldouronate transport system permease protein
MVKSSSTKFGDWIIVVLCVLLILICLLPILCVVAKSLSSAEALIRNEVLFLPKGLNFEAYSMVLEDQDYRRSIIWTAFLTVICTVISMIMTTICAFPLTYDKLKGKKVINAFILFTMYFNAGTIPMYLLLKKLDWISKPIVLIIPYTLSVFNMIIMKSFLYGIPESMRESAEIDGANPIRILINIYLPMSTPVIASLSLFYAVGRWNGFSDALMFMNDRKYYPIQQLLYYLINNMQAIDTSNLEGFNPPGMLESVRAATIMVATVPILLVYPWLQRYFVSGVSLGAVKG